jgi:hypothetical protein
MRRWRNEGRSTKGGEEAKMSRKEEGNQKDNREERREYSKKIGES